MLPGADTLWCYIRWYSQQTVLGFTPDCATGTVGVLSSWQPFQPLFDLGLLTQWVNSNVAVETSDGSTTGGQRVASQWWYV